MTCEEYVIQLLEDSRKELEESKAIVAMRLMECNRLANILAVIQQHIKLETYGKSRVISLENIWENSDAPDFAALYEAFRDKFEEEEADNGEQSEST